MLNEAIWSATLLLMVVSLKVMVTTPTVNPPGATGCNVGR